MSSTTLFAIDTWADGEMRAAKICDERQRPNLIKICDSIARHPELSFSSACGSAQRKAGWRLFSSQAVDLQSGHVEQTWLRCQHYERILIAEDSTDANYAGHHQSKGLGKLGGRKDRDVSGLNIPSALAMNQDGQPLGLIGQRIWAPSSQGKARGRQYYPIEQKESIKWIEALQWCNACFQNYLGKVLMISDREADFYEHFAQPRQTPIDLLVRVKYVNRLVYYQGQRLSLAVLQQSLPLLGRVSITIASGENKHESRQITLELRTANIQCPASMHRKGKAIDLSFVSATQVAQEVIEGEEPVQWLLLSTLPLPIDTALSQACQWITFYTYRWNIERFHFILKQGLRIEKLQFDTFQRLSNALKIYSVVAWHLMSLAYAAQTMPEVKAQTIAQDTDIELLQTCTQKNIITVGDFILALGKLVGFQPCAKQAFPGEKLLWQALSIFLNIKHGFDIAQQIQSNNCGTG